MILVSDSVLLYGGLCLAGGAVVAAAVYAFVWRARARRLNAELDAEYGPAPQKAARTQKRRQGKTL